MGLRTAHRAARRSITLQSVDGPRRVMLRDTATASATDPARPPETRAVLVDALTDRAKQFRKRLRAATDARAADDVGARVHDLRTAARRLLAVLDALQSFVSAAAVRRLARPAEKALDQVGALRDLTVQRDTLAKLRGHASAPLLKAFDRELRRKTNRIAAKLRKRLDSVRRGKLRRDARRLKKRVRGCRMNTTDARNLALRAAHDAFERLCDTRAAMDPNDPATLHATRIALKRLRYLMEELRPAYPVIRKTTIASLHSLQTTLGALHDLDVLTESLAKYVHQHAPARAAEITSVLERVERRHCAILLSCLRGIDAVLQPWKRLLAA